MATDLDVGIRIEVPGFQVEASGTVVLPISRFGSILRESSDDQLRLENDGTKIRVRGGRSQFQLPGENPDEFPDVGGFSAQSYYTLPARFFRELVRRTTYATETESSRYALGGVLLEFSADQITGVATDGRRLARQQGPVQCTGEPQARENTILPTRSMQLIERALAANEGDIDLATRDNDILIRSQGLTFYSRLVEGRFPRWRDVFPRTEQMTRIELTVGPFYSAVRQAAIVTSENHRGVDFTFGGGKVSMIGRGAELGESEVELPIAYDGPNLSVTLDPRYMNEFLKTLPPDQVINVHVRDAESAVMAETDDGYSYVIMPLARE